MSFTLLPAVDVAGARSVRLTQGEPGSASDLAIGDSDPLETALTWQADGAEWIHLVDLDAAFGRGSNAKLLDGIIAKLDVSVELAGGITDDASLSTALSTSCARIVLGAAALDDLEWCAQAIAEHGERIAVGLDVRISELADGSEHYQLAARGRHADTTSNPDNLWETIEVLDAAGCAHYVVTDVSRDGMLSGPNLELYRAVTTATSTPVIASGGVSTLADLHTLANLATAGANLEGSIVGKALYASHFTLTEALAVSSDNRSARG